MICEIFLILQFSYITCLDKCVNTNSGKICGTTFYYQNTPVHTFLGIPFAEPPVGKLRFKKPEPIKPWNDTLTANEMPHACHQFTNYPYPWYDPYPGKSEDCLYLNLWIPPCTERGDGKAVIFWIYGGGFTFGSNRKDLYDGRVLACEGDVIIVTVNYRVGVFGFLTSGTEEAPGNVGLYDILEALKWVRANIVEFGGSPDRITIQGQSAGSFVVSIFCISPLTKNLFAKAIMESGSIIFFKSNSLEDNLRLSQKVAEEAGCTPGNLRLKDHPEEVIDCLREKNPIYLSYILYSINPTSTRSFGPQYGNEFLPVNTVDELKAGHFHQLPLLIGNNEDEGSFQITTSNLERFGFFGKKDPTINKTEGAAIIRKIFKNYLDPDSVVQHYLGSLAEKAYEDIRYQVYTASGDFSLLCPTVYFAESYAAAGSNVYFYFFRHRPSITPWADWMGVAHFEEVQFVFGLPLRKSDLYQPKEILLSAKMVQMWSFFAKFGRPPRSSEWTKYSKDNHTYLILNTDSEINRFGIGPHLENCNFFRDYYGF